MMDLRFWVREESAMREMKGDGREKERLQFKYRVLYGTDVVCKDVKIELLRTKKIVKAKLFYVPCTLGSKIHEAATSCSI